MFGLRQFLSIAVGAALLSILGASCVFAGTYNFGGGQGTLYYASSEISSGTCGTYEHLTSYTIYEFSNFSYTDPYGSSWSLAGTTTYASSGSGQGCPASGGRSITFTESPFTITFTPTSGTYGNATVAFLGQIGPKYQVLSVLYAPPGHQSYATYGNQTMVGTSTTYSSSFTSSSSQSVTMGGSASLDIFSRTYSTTADSTYQQEQDSTNSIDVTTQSGASLTVSGPTNDALGTDSDGYSVLHDSDLILVWLNPTQQVAVTPESVALGREQFNSSDPNGSSNMDVPIGPTCYDFLQPTNFQALDYDQFKHFLRAWDSSGVGGFTTTDWQAVAAQDPYCGSPGIGPQPGTTAFQTRFQGPINSISGAYAPPGCPTCQPVKQNFNQQWQETNMQGQSAQNSHSQSFSESFGFSIGQGDFSA